MDEYVAGICVKCGHISHRNDRCVNCGSENISRVGNIEYMEMYWGMTDLTYSSPDTTFVVTCTENGKVPK